MTTVVRIARNVVLEGSKTTVTGNGAMVCCAQLSAMHCVTETVVEPIQEYVPPQPEQVVAAFSTDPGLLMILFCTPAQNPTAHPQPE